MHTKRPFRVRTPPGSERSAHRSGVLSAAVPLVIYLVVLVSHPGCTGGWLYTPSISVNPRRSDCLPGVLVGVPLLRHHVRRRRLCTRPPTTATQPSSTNRGPACAEYRRRSYEFVVPPLSDPGTPTATLSAASRLLHLLRSGIRLYLQHSTGHYHGNAHRPQRNPN